MSVHGLLIDARILTAIAEHAERDYPVEACGVVLGGPDDGALARVVPLKNTQDRYHQRDPIAFPRTGKDAFRLDELERMRMLDDASSEGLVERILYHSHCDAGAYFSPEDRAMAVQDGQELMPGVVHVVISVRGGVRKDAAAFRWDGSGFVEARIDPLLLGLSSPGALPDLSMRRLEGREASRPIRPVGGFLGPRRVTELEASAIAAIVEAKVTIDERAIGDLIAFGLGLYSPIEGFFREAEIRSLEMRGRLISGEVWRDPVTLIIPKAQFPKNVAAGAVIELVAKDGAAIGALALVEARPLKDRVGLAGPVYVYPRPHGTDAAESRAQLLRIGATKVLAVAGPLDGLDLDGFDAFLSATPLPGRTVFPWISHDRSPWLTAVMAQNQGATHLALPPGQLEAWTFADLAIQLCPKV
jgi:[CysO sulfur-carrier protein]-S-L-cysteine hydrolase